MSKPDRSSLGRALAAFLALTLILPGPALALRQTGLEESEGEDKPKAELVTALRSSVVSMPIFSAPSPSFVPLSVSAGAEEQLVADLKALKAQFEEVEGRIYAGQKPRNTQVRLSKRLGRVIETLETGDLPAAQKIMKMLRDYLSAAAPKDFEESADETKRYLSETVSLRQQFPDFLRRIGLHRPAAGAEEKYMEVSSGPLFSWSSEQSESHWEQNVSSGQVFLIRYLLQERQEVRQQLVRIPRAAHVDYLPVKKIEDGEEGDRPIYVSDPAGQPWVSLSPGSDVRMGEMFAGPWGDYQIGAKEGGIALSWDRNRLSSLEIIPMGPASAPPARMKEGQFLGRSIRGLMLLLNEYPPDRVDLFGPHSDQAIVTTHGSESARVLPLRLYKAMGEFIPFSALYQASYDLQFYRVPGEAALFAKVVIHLDVEALFVKSMEELELYRGDDVPYEQVVELLRQFPVDLLEIWSRSSRLIAAHIFGPLYPPPGQDFGDLFASTARSQFRGKAPSRTYSIRIVANHNKVPFSLYAKVTAAGAEETPAAAFIARKYRSLREWDEAKLKKIRQALKRSRTLEFSGEYSPLLQGLLREITAWEMLRLDYLPGPADRIDFSVFSEPSGGMGIFSISNRVTGVADFGQVNSPRLSFPPGMIRQVSDDLSPQAYEEAVYFPAFREEVQHSVQALWRNHIYRFTGSQQEMVNWALLDPPPGWRARSYYPSAFLQMILLESGAHLADRLFGTSEDRDGGAAFFFVDPYVQQPRLFKGQVNPHTMSSIFDAVALKKIEKWARTEKEVAVLTSRFEQLYLLSEPERKEPVRDDAIRLWQEIHSPAFNEAFRAALWNLAPTGQPLQEIVLLLGKFREMSRLLTEDGLALDPEAEKILAQLQKAVDLAKKAKTPDDQAKAPFQSVQLYLLILNKALSRGSALAGFLEKLEAMNEPQDLYAALAEEIQAAQRHVREANPSDHRTQRLLRDLLRTVSAESKQLAGAEELITPSRLAERMGGLARVWDGYTSAESGKMAPDALLAALAPKQVTIDFPATIPSVKLLEGLTLWVDSSLAGLIPAKEWGVTVRVVDPADTERVIREEIPKGGIILLDQARYTPELHRSMKTLLKGLGHQGIWIAAGELQRMDASELAMTLEILKRSGIPLPSAGMERELDGDRHRFLYA